MANPLQILSGIAGTLGTVGGRGALGLSEGMVENEVLKRRFQAQDIANQLAMLELVRQRNYQQALPALPGMFADVMRPQITGVSAMPAGGLVRPPATAPPAAFQPQPEPPTMNEVLGRIAQTPPPIRAGIMEMLGPAVLKERERQMAMASEQRMYQQQLQSVGGIEQLMKAGPDRMRAVALRVGGPLGETLMKVAAAQQSGDFRALQIGMQELNAQMRMMDLQRKLQGTQEKLPTPHFLTGQGGESVAVVPERDESGKIVMRQIPIPGTVAAKPTQELSMDVRTQLRGMGINPDTATPEQTQKAIAEVDRRMERRSGIIAEQGAKIREDVATRKEERKTESQLGPMQTALTQMKKELPYLRDNGFLPRELPPGATDLQRAMEMARAKYVQKVRGQFDPHWQNWITNQGSLIGIDRSVFNDLGRGGMMMYSAVKNFSESPPTYSAANSVFEQFQQSLDARRAGGRGQIVTPRPAGAPASKRRAIGPDGASGLLPGDTDLSKYPGYRWAE